MKVTVIGGGGRVGSCAAFALQCSGLVSSIQILDANTELDVMIETANLPARDEFRRITQEEGLKAAIAWRDSRYRGTE